MTENAQLQEFDKLVKKRFNLYNSMFLNLPYYNVENLSMLIPLLQHEGKLELEAGISPLNIIDNFVQKHLNKNNEQQNIDFMFRVIQYVERQIVLYDSIEEAAYEKVNKLGNDLSIKDFFHLYENKTSLTDIQAKLSEFSARFVFTAHPTQFYSPAVLEIISNLRKLVNNNKINEIDIILQQLGLTSLLNQEKPSPLDEAKNVIYYLRNVYYNAIADFYTQIKRNIQNKDFNNPNILKLGFWPGGDRDGNPFVTADISLAVADELRLSLMKCYYSDLRKLEAKLSFPKVEPIIKKLRAKLYETMFDASKDIHFQDIDTPLQEIKILVKQEYNNLYHRELSNLIYKVHIFKTHFANLDIRQDHSIHKKTVEAILIQQKLINESIDELSDDTLTDILLNKNFEISIEELPEDIMRETLKTISILSEIQRKNGEDGCNRYIISNSEDIYSVLFVFALFRWTGWNIENLSFDIIPLFETMLGMQRSEEIMHTLFKIPVYRNHVSNRTNKQTMMLGFSDGTKDGGYLQANWSIFRTKERLTAVCKEYEIRAIFFDGRGGPPARGGGKTHRFYASQGSGIANHEIQLTIQGQTISSKYGTKEHFIHNSEQLLTAGLSNSLFEKQNDISVENRKLIETLAESSYQKYVELKNHPKFISYLEKKSTLKYYGATNIGSRPAKRGANKELTLSDLRAISYVGSWSQLKQNVPGFYGIGYAINKLAEEGKTEELKNLFKEVPFFRALIQNSMMSISKSNFQLTAYMNDDAEFGEFWNILFEEYKLSKKMTLWISQYHELMDDSPISKHSVEIREQLVLPLLLIQQYALQKIEENSEFKEIYEKIVTRSLYGNINASRNSA